MDVNAIVKKYLDGQLGLAGVGIYCPRLPEKATLPALGFFVRGGSSTPYIPQLVSPSFQFDCWGASSLIARAVYSALYDCLQGIQDISVVIAPNTYYIVSAREEVQGYDMVDVENSGYHRVLTFFEIMIKGG